MVPRLHDYDLTGLTARITLVVAPILVFQTFPTRGAFSMAMTVPAVVLAAGYVGRRARRIPTWELALAGLLAISVVWGDDPGYSVSRLRLFLPVLLATVLAANLVDPRTVLACLKASFLVMVGSALVYLALVPSTRYSDGYSGLAIHGQYPKNGYGSLLVFAILLVMCARRSWWTLSIPVMVVLLALTKSTTAWVLAIAIVGVVVFVRLLARRQVVSDVSTLAWAGLSSVGLAVLGLVFSDRLFLGLVGKDPTLTSRTAIWSACWTEIRNAPLLGHGAFTFLDTASESPVTLRIWSHFSSTYLPPHPHNGLLDLWGQLGLVGVVTFAVLVVTTFRGAVRRGGLRSRVALTGLTGLVFILLFGTTESSYLGSWLVVTVMCSAIADSSPATRPQGDEAVAPSQGESARDPASDAVGRHRADPLAAPVGAS